MKKILIVCLFFIAYNSYAKSIDEALTLFNHQEYKLAESGMEALAKQNNSRAIFWLGVIQFRTGEQFKAGSTFLKAANAGDPWAMLMMVPSKNGYCDYLGWNCDEKWMNKAIEGWKKLAVKGNGNAMYAIAQWEDKPWWSFVPVLSTKKDGELIEKMVKAGAYDAAGDLQFKLDIKKRIALLNYAAKNNYAPAMVALYTVNERNLAKINNSMELLKKASELGYGVAIAQIYYHYFNKIPKIKTVLELQNLTDSQRKSINEAYYYSIIAMNYRLKYVDFDYDLMLKDVNGNLVKKSIISPKDKSIIEKRAGIFIKKTKINMYIDESSSIDQLLNP